MNDNASEDTLNAADLDPRTTPLYKTSPERIWLAICDEFPGIWQLDFNTYADVTWYAGEPPVSVTIGYVRADLYESLQTQLAAANERADRYKEFWEATLLDCREAGERADVKAAAHSDMAEMYRKEKERADGLQKIVDEARAQSPAATIVEIDDGLGTTFLEFNEPRGPAGTNYYAAPVLSQPAVVPEGLRARYVEICEAEIPCLVTTLILLCDVWAAYTGESSILSATEVKK